MKKYKMEKNNNTNNGGSIGFAGLLTIAFIVLKLIGVITWSWWWVLSPVWITFLLVFTLVLVVGLFTWIINK